MSTEEQESVIVPWGTDDDTEILSLTLPSREILVQLEVPEYVLERMSQLGDEHGIPVETALAERLEINRARTSLLVAKAAEDLTVVQDNLTDARNFISGVETLDTSDIETEIHRLWSRELDST
jgi:hypothetical protein